MRDNTVLIIEDNERLQRLLRQALRSRYTVLTASCWKQAAEIRSRSPVDAVLVDMRLVSGDRVDGDGLSVDRLCAETGKMPFIMLVGSPSRPESAQAGGDPPLLLASAASPVELCELPRTLDEAIGTAPAHAVNFARAAADENGILTESCSMRVIMALVDRAAVRDTPVLLIGESGTGKELLARALHRKSPRAAGPFVAVNCSAIPETLLESELFGHRRGAFTDAREDQRGLFQTAEGGTVFLDEIGDMAPALQGKLLRVLQEKEVHPLGAPAPVPVDMRIVTATHRDLTTLVSEGRFRQDLLYRINVIELRVPPLRERPDDLAPLVGYLVGKHGAKLGKARCTVAPDAMGLLRDYPWPGNVRELENVIERALVLGNDSVIDVEDLPDSVKERPTHSGAASTGRLADVEREHIVRILRAVDGNKAAAARILGLNRKTLYRKLTQHRIAVR